MSRFGLPPARPPRWSPRGGATRERRPRTRAAPLSLSARAGRSGYILTVTSLKMAVPGVAVGLLGAALSKAAARWGYGVSWSARDGAAILATLAAFLIVHLYAVRSDDTLRRAGILIAVLVFAVSAANTILLLFPVQEYGDNAYIVVVVDSAKPFSRWLTGSAVLTGLYAGLWKFPPVLALLPASVTSAHGCFYGEYRELHYAVGDLSVLREWTRDWFRTFRRGMRFGPPTRG
jgi:hypothetical protein